MHKLLKRSMAILLSVLMTVTLVPYSTIPVYAAGNGEAVLSSLSHTDAVATANISGFNVTLTVPYGYADPSIDTADIDYTIDSDYVEDSVDYSASAIDVDGSSVIMDISYTYAAGDDTTTVFQSSYYVSVVEGDAPTFSGTISKSTNPTGTITFDDSDFTAKYDANDGDSLAAISIGAPSSTSYGTLELNGSDYVSDTVVTVAELGGGDLTFSASAAGTVTYTVTAYSDTDGNDEVGTATLSITVSKPTAAKISYSTVQNDPVDFNDAHFISACTGAVGGTFDYIEFAALPSSSKGKLYTDYDTSSKKAVATGTDYDASDLDSMTFVPYTDYTGTVSISYTGFNTDNEEYTGTIEVTVTAPTSDVAKIKYNTDEDVPVSFDGADFSDACDDEFNENLDYVKFTLPASTKGILYVNYTSSSDYDSKVSSSTKYDETDIDDIDFVPKSGYYGTFTITYTGYYNNGDDTYKGTVEITVDQDESDVDAITYTGNSGEAIDFDGGDFVDVFEDQNDFDGETFDEVKFTLPSSTYGILYTGYTSSSDYDAKVSATTRYDESDIDDISFVSKSTYKGTVTITYTGYYDNGAESYTGKVKITVGSSTTAGVISLTTKEDTPITFNDDKFNDICEDETDETLDYVKFTLPSNTYGKLYYNYTSASSYSSVVSATTKYYYDGTPSLSKVTFVPYKDYNGTVTIKYTGYNTDGDSFTGTVKITVTAVAETGASAYFKDVTNDYAWAAPSIDALYKAGVVTGTGSNMYSPAANITRGDFMLMLYRALGLKASTSGNFADVPSGSYYYTAIAVAKSLGVAQGSGGYFYPTSAITREDAMVLVARAMKADGQTLPSGTLSDLSGFNDRSQVSDYAISAVGGLVKAGIIKGSNGYLSPKSPVTRAEMAVILYRVTQL